MTVTYEFTSDEKILIDNNFTGLDSEEWNKEVYTELKKSIRKYLIDINQQKCFYCKTLLKQGTSLIPIEHILDKSSHPKFTFEPINLTVSCTACNTNKGKINTLLKTLEASDEYPSDSKDFNIIHAYFDIYDRHIRIDRGIFFIGQTVKGKKTIEICKLYRSKLAEEKFLDLKANSNYHEICTKMVRTTDVKMKQLYEHEVQKIINSLDNAKNINELVQILAQGEIYDLIIREFYNGGLRDSLQLISLQQLDNYKNLICNTEIIEKIKFVIGRKKIHKHIKEQVSQLQTGKIHAEDFNKEMEMVLSVSDKIVDFKISYLSAATQEVIQLIGKLSRSNGRLRRLLLSIEPDMVVRLQKTIEKIKEENEFILELKKLLLLKEIIEKEDIKLNEYNNILKRLI